MTALPAHRHRDLVRLLTSSERLLGRRVAAVLATEGHTLDSWRVISLLADDDSLPMTELADRAFLPPATLTKLIDQLTEQNLVYRRVDEIDRRRIRAHLTARGHRLHERIRLGVEGAVSMLLPAGPERELLEDLLTQLVHAMDGAPVAR